MDVAAGVIWRSGKILVAERQKKSSDSEDILWEFPGGKQEVSESLEDCLKRELLEELDILISPPDFLTTIQHAYPHIQIRLHCFQATWVEREPRSMDGQLFQWIAPERLRQLKMTQADMKALNLILDPGNLAKFSCVS